jgi:Fe-Mn family superoxide dismutase
MFKLPELNYETMSEKNFISEETVDFHVYKHHLSYLNKLNQLIENDKSLQNLTLIEIIKISKGDIFNNAAQSWNHAFFWNCLLNKIKFEIPDKLQIVIEGQYGSISNLKDKFKEMCLANFGSGWTWIVLNTHSSKVEILNTSNADNPLILSTNYIPLLVCDLWEHAYYIDYRNNRSKYIDAFWENINWAWVDRCYENNNIQEIIQKN